MHFNPKSGEFLGQFILDSKMMAFTIIHIAEYVKGSAWYPLGAEVVVFRPDGKELDHYYAVTE